MIGRGEVVAITAIAILFGVAFSYPIVAHLGELRVHADWDVFWDRRWIPYVTLAVFHQLPLGISGDAAGCRCSPSCSRAS